jgi:hypothetical protein
MLKSMYVSCLSNEVNLRCACQDISSLKMYFASSLSWNEILNHLHLWFIMAFLFPYGKN